MTTNPPAVTRPVYASLDELWKEAAVIGKPKIEQDYQGRFSACIDYTTPGGSHIFARGVSEKSPNEAMGLAIKEARMLYAGYVFASA